MRSPNDSRCLSLWDGSELNCVKKITNFAPEIGPTTNFQSNFQKKSKSKSTTAKQTHLLGPTKTIKNPKRWPRSMSASVPWDCRWPPWLVPCMACVLEEEIRRHPWWSQLLGEVGGALVDSSPASSHNIIHTLGIFYIDIVRFVRSRIKNGTAHFRYNAHLPTHPFYWQRYFLADDIPHIQTCLHSQMPKLFFALSLPNRGLSISHPQRFLRLAFVRPAPSAGYDPLFSLY